MVHSYVDAISVIVCLTLFEISQEPDTGDQCHESDEEIAVQLDYVTAPTKAAESDFPTSVPLNPTMQQDESSDRS